MENDVVGTAEDRFGRSVRKFREEQGLKQAELAQRVTELGHKMHPSAIAKIELRDVDSPRSIRINEAEALARALGVPLEDLLGEANRDRQMAGAFVSSLTRVQRLRERVGLTVDEWLSAKSFLAHMVAAIEDEEGLLDRMEEQVYGIRGISWPEARQLITESLSDVVDAYMERQHGEHPEA